MREVAGFAVITLCVALLMLLGELLARIFRVAKLPPRKTNQVLSPLLIESGEERYSIRHLERSVLMSFAWYLAFLLLMTHGTVLESYLSPDAPALWIVIIGSVLVWWAYRRGVLR